MPDVCNMLRLFFRDPDYYFRTVDGANRTYPIIPPKSSRQAIIPELLKERLECTKLFAEEWYRLIFQFNPIFGINPMF
jgi:hypothetical protein